MATDPLERFWIPPPSSTSSIPAICAALPSFPAPPLRVSRVGQLDASLLDHELEGILSAPVTKALAMINRGRRSWEPEMVALLRIAVLKLSLYDKGATYGSVLQNFKYRNERKHGEGYQPPSKSDSLTPLQKTAYMAFQVLPGYLSARLRDRMLTASWSDQPLPRSWFSLVDVRRLSRRRRRRNEEEEDQWGREWKRVAWEVMGLGEKLGAMAGLANFLVFLYDGKYRTLIDRLLGMRLVYAQRSVNRNVSFEFLNRQLVWEAFTEFLLFLVPLVNMHRLRMRVSRFLTSTASSSKVISAVVSALPVPILTALRIPTRKSPPPNQETPNQEKRRPEIRPEGPLHFLPSTTCPICYSQSDPSQSTSLDPSSAAAPGGNAPGPEDMRVRVPYVTNCGWECRYCYYCVVQRMVACEEEGEECWSCLRCGGEVTAVDREVVVVHVEEEKEEEEEEEGGGTKVELEDGEGEDSNPMEEVSVSNVI